eukprot:12985798-Alexandrium_andersonii.AAC.1
MCIRDRRAGVPAPDVGSHREPRGAGTPDLSNGPSIRTGTTSSTPSRAAETAARRGCPTMTHVGP